MSLVQFAIRVTLTRALQAALPGTFPVLDSPQEPVTTLWGADPKPLVAIFSGNTDIVLQGRNLLGGAARVAIQIQFILPEAVSFSIGAGALKIDTRRQGAEAAFDVLWRTAARALNGSNEPWAALWREFVLQTPKISVDSYMVVAEGVRAPGRQVILTCDPLHEPTPGGAPEGPWATLLTLMRADTGDDGLSSLANWLEQEIRAGADLSQEDRDRIYMGLSGYVAESIGVGGPYGDVENDATATADDEAPADPALFTEQDE